MTYGDLERRVRSFGSGLLQLVNPVLFPFHVFVMYIYYICRLVFPALCHHMIW